MEMAFSDIRLYLFSIFILHSKCPVRKPIHVVSTDFYLYTHQQTLETYNTNMYEYKYTI